MKAAANPRRVITARRIIALLVVVNVCLVAVYGKELQRRVEFHCTGKVQVNGLTYYLQPDDAYLTEYILDSGSYEVEETRLFREKVRPGDTVIDVGANIGWYTIIASKLVGDQGRVIAFEPDPTSFDYLRRNVEANGCKNVTIEQKALSNEQGSIELFLAEEHKGTHRIFDIGEGRKSVTVEAVRLDDYLGDLKSTVNVIKVDTEGAEGVIFEGMEETVRQSPNVKLFMEFAPDGLRLAGYDPQKLFQRCAAHGFSFQGVSERHGRVVAVDGWKELLDAQAADPTLLNLYMERTSAGGEADRAIARTESK